MDCGAGTGAVTGAAPAEQVSTVSKTRLVNNQLSCCHQSQLSGLTGVSRCQLSISPIYILLHWLGKRKEERDGFMR